MDYRLLYECKLNLIFEMRSGRENFSGEVKLKVKT